MKNQASFRGLRAAGSGRSRHGPTVSQGRVLYCVIGISP